MKMVLDTSETLLHLLVKEMKSELKHLALCELPYV